MNVVGYVRVSTAEQAYSGAGLEAQRSAIKAEAARRGWQLVRIHEDAGASGKSLKRPGLTDALEAVERGEAQALVVSKLDRLSRSVVDFAGLVARAQRRGWALVAAQPRTGGQWSGARHRFRQPQTPEATRASKPLLKRPV